jgi:peptidoglycan/xylan/chitin deacetylase (PgdA/CDA1 family)
MRLPGSRRMRQVARRLRARFSSKVLILLYHRVRPVPCCDPYALGVTPEHFAEHLEILRQHARPMRLQQLMRALQEGNLPRRAVVVTFDDGYADNLYNARPILERQDFPATVFVTTGYVDQAREFWWDQLERLLLHPGTVPETLELDIDGTLYQWDLGKAATYEESDYRRYCDWHYGRDTEPSLRHQLFRSLYYQLAPLPDTKRRDVLEALQLWAQGDSQGRPTHRVLSPDEVVRLAEGGLIEVGAHTVTHPVLASLPIASQRNEIQGSKAQLERILGKTVASFAYPYGSRARADYTEETVAVVRQAGFTGACSTLAQPVHRDTDGFQLPRAGVRDWNGDELAERLKVWFGG